jgi:hypothetical protein
LTFLHSCGNVVNILDDLIETSLDITQRDRQEDMGLEMLGERFAGHIRSIVLLIADVQTMIRERGD